MEDLFATFFDDVAAGNAATPSSTAGSLAKGTGALLVGSIVVGAGAELGKEGVQWGGSKLFSAAAGGA